MTRRAFAFAACWLSVLVPMSSRAADDGIAAAWVQLGPGGVNEARVVVPSNKCPRLLVDGAEAAMHERATAGANFRVRVCVLALPKTAKQASVLGHDLPLLSGPPKRIVVIGDTGCRIKGSTVQACNDPAKWPFATVAREAAKLEPDLIIHVGDYLYREGPCPAEDKECAGTPWGDTWPTWAADFFTPAAPLLGAAPWVVVRGNHESCDRSGAGWLRFLGPLSIAAVAPCTDHVAPYVVPLGEVNLVVMDDTAAPDLYSDAAVVPTYEADFASLKKLARAPEWLAMHRPLWGAVTGPFGITMGGNRTMIAALKDERWLDSIELMLSGHIHSFEALNYDKGPPQIVAGNGGDKLDVVPADLSRANLSGRSVKDGLSLPGFGFLLMTRESNGWDIEIYRVDGARARQCRFVHRRIDCGKP